jgi:YD repeat-containing protein
LPNLDEVRDESRLEREAPPPIASTIRSQKNTGKPWDGRRVGDPWPQKKSNHATNRSVRTPPLLFDDQFVQNFYACAVARNPVPNENTYWYDHLRVAYAQGQASLKLAAIELGRSLFELAEYTVRNRDNHWYVYDLYKAYLMRDPDPTGWANWEATVATHGREYVRRGFEESGEFAAIVANLVPNGPATANAASLISARVDPRNQPGNGMLTRDASWTVPLLSLPGRAGLDLGLTLSYSSMVWTRSGPFIYFDEDNGFPSPGFRLGFPTVQRKVFDAQTARNAYLLLTASGKRVELRQVGTSNIYDAADSSYLRLTDNGATLQVQSTDGTKLSLAEINGEYRCTEVKDRNGNYITVNYNSLGRITNIIDTLGRVITFNYDSNANLLSITQSWNGQPSHQWVSFGWGTRTMQSSFSNPTLYGVVGTVNGALLPVITQVALNDTSYFTFDYTNSLQLSVVRNYFGTLERNASSFTYETPAGDAPRLLDSRVSANNWTGLNNVPSQVITQYSVAGDGACVMTAPDGTIYKEYYGTGWQKGLTTLSEVWSGGVRRKWTTTAWTQDDTTLPYPKNPRPYDTSVNDETGNRRRTETVYSIYNLPDAVALPTEVKEYAANGTSVLRRTTITYYDGGQPYVDRRVLGLLREVIVYDANNQPQSKVWYDYDWNTTEFWAATPQPATQHDASGDARGRGNLVWIGRWDVSDINNFDKHRRSYIKYNRTGSVIKTEDHSGHGNTISYTDSFSDAVNRNTFAFPTTVTDAAGSNFYTQYSFDLSATTRIQSPAPAGQAQGTIQTLTYNNLGQLERITTTNNGAYKRFWYGADYTASYAAVNNIADQLYSIQVVDGLGRVIGAVSNHPGSTGQYRLVNTVYNVMGRAWKQSNPTEVNNVWAPSGDDAAGIYYTQQTYDWQGRPLVTTNPDGTTREASYAGCGCAGGTVITLTDEGTVDAGVAKRRQQKIYSDVLGRTTKTEGLNWQNGSVYATTVTGYNARDQVDQIVEYAGAEGSGTYQQTTMTYDGLGRLKTKHAPEQNAGTVTTYTYDNDDLLSSVIDARGAATIYAYNNRHLVSGITYTAPAGSNIAIPPPASYAYDAAGNRASMTDGLGSVTYNYNSLSRMTSEVRYISQSTTPLTYSISYDYNLAGDLTRITDPNNKTINYNRDSIGRLSSVTGPSFAGVTSYTSGLQYRAWGAVKHANYWNGETMDVTFNSRLKATSFQIPSLMSKTYDYYADGTLKFSSDALDHRFDRLYRWDHAGRIKEAYSGAEARGEAPTTNRPYKQTYAYDPMGHLTTRTNATWGGGTITTSDSYINNRDQFWSYDADGNILSMPGIVYSYDAGGRINAAWSDGSTTFNLDGDGKRIKSVEIVWDPAQERNVTTNVFYVYSSVLGRLLTEKSTFDDPNSPYAYFNSRTFVYGDTGVIAWQESNTSLQEWVEGWEHRDPSNASYRTGFNSSNPGDQQELDPTGANHGISELSYQSIPEEGILAPYPASNNPSHPNTTYSVDGIRVSLDDFIQNLQMFFKGDLGLNEALARQSADDRNYQRRWVRRGGYADYYRFSTVAGDDDRVVTTVDTTRVYFGQWQTSALSLNPSLGWLLGQSKKTKNSQNPPSVKNATPDQQSRFNDAYNEFRKRLNTNNGKNRCADFLGGVKNAEKALKATNFSFGRTEDGAGAETLGKNVTIDPNGLFMGTGGSATIQVGFNLRERHGYYITLNDVQVAAFVLTHETGHRVGKLQSDGNDPFGFLSVMNNGRIQKACFDDVTPSVGPLPPGFR